VLEIRRNYVRVNGRAVEKDTKTHRMRRIALDPDTVELLAAHRGRFEAAIRSSEGAFVFSHQAAHDRPYSPDGVTPLREDVREARHRQPSTRDAPPHRH
jgi:integrase